MKEFWRLCSTLLCLGGFLITGGILLLQGLDLLAIILRAITVFAVMYCVQGVLGALFVAVSESSHGKDARYPEMSVTPKTNRN